MTAKARLHKVEASLSPQAIVLRWLEEAQTFPSFTDHARAVADLPVSEAPLSRIGRDAAASVRTALRGQPKDRIDKAVDQATGDGVFLFCLVIQLNQEALDTARYEEIRAAAIALWAASADCSCSPDRLDAQAKSTASWGEAVGSIATLIAEEALARRSLEQRYLAGHAALFRDVADAWRSVEVDVMRLLAIAEARSLIDLSGEGDPALAADVESATRIETHARELADSARVRAFEVLGQRPRAVAILERRLRGDDAA